MCDDLACSREHVPPRNLFPEAKECEGEDLRRNLITVPSCAAHNSGKSRDDEFLMVGLAGIIGNNSIGYRHKFSKVNRAITRSAHRLLWEVFNGAREVFVVEVGGNKYLDVIWGTPDHDRLMRCFDRIARGLFFHHFGSRFRGTVKVMLGYTHHKDPSAANFQRFIRDKVERELVGKEQFGANPQVFSYQVTDADVLGLRTLRLCFYGGLNVYAAFLPEGAVLPKSLAFELMNRGLKTFLRLDDRYYEMN